MVALLAGTMAVRHGRDLMDSPREANRAHLMLPDGQVFFQDKLCLTPPERNPSGWHLATGQSLQIVRWRGLRIATVICLDIELPALAARLWIQWRGGGTATDV